MGDKHDDTDAIKDGRPVEVREGPEAQTDDEAREDIADDETVENVGY